MDMSTEILTSTLRQVRKTQRLSQLELSLRLGVSQRHVSFVESGRAKPSRELLLAWLQELDAPLVVRNEVMLQAGYAPVYTSALLDDPALAQVNSAL
jgi:transcriptional regulator with XRE-family HTH domain